MRTILLTCLTALGLLLSSSVMAQVKTVTGTVADSGTRETLPGVNVLVKGTTIGAMTDGSGFYSIKVSPGQIIQISFIGYKTQEITVGDANRYDVLLEQDVQALGEVVVTAEFGTKRIDRSIGSSVQTIKASEIAESGRDNFISALQGRVAGINVGSSSGAPGASTKVVLRSVTSISGNNQPLYVVDGVPMNNSTFDPLAFADGGANYSVRNLDFSSRGNDFNPEDIESMTVLKGAAAAALYGSDASNGAIIITTKKGSAGKGKISYSNSFRFDKAYGYPDIQQKYANGAYGTTNWYYTSRWGNRYEDGTQFYDNISSLLQTGFTQKHNISVEGGNEKTTLRASAKVTESEGVVKTTNLSQLNLSISGRSEIQKWLTVEGSMSYTSSKNNKAPLGTDGPLYRTILWPIVDDMSNYLAADGMHMRYPNYYTDTDLLNPLFGLHKNKLYDESDRFLSIMSINFTPIKNAFIRAQMGWDVGMQTFIAGTHPYYYDTNNGVGTFNMAKSNFSDPSLNVLAGYNNSMFNDKVTYSFQVGYHQLENGVSRSSIYGTKFAVPDLLSIINCETSTVTAKQRHTKRRIQAISAQMEFGYNRMAYLTFRGRNDWSSTLPIDNRRFFYPAVEGSFILTEMPFMSNVKNYVDYLKIRGSVARVGKDAGPLEIEPELIGTGLTGGGFRYDFTGPNKLLKPEMTTSKEIGFEGRFLNNRVNADFTYFWTHCDDQLVKGFRLSYATGFVLNNMNLGTFETWGWEGHIDGDIIKNTNVVWNVGINASHTGSEVVYLPPAITEYYNAYSWNSGNIRNGIMKGKPVTTITGNPYTRNDKGQILISPSTGMPYISDSKWTVLGDREPKIRFGIQTYVKYKDFSVSANFSGRLKATVVNGTKRTLMTNGLSEESVKLRESGPVIFDGVLKDGNENTTNPTINNIAVSWEAYGSSIYTGCDEDWIEKGVNYLRLQELRIAYNIPERILKRTPITTANIFVTGNDLLTWTNYSGIDAVGNTMSAAAGGTGGEGIDVWSLPSPRGITFGLSITIR